MTESAAEWLGLGSNDLDTVAFDSGRFLGNVKADIKNAFAHIEPSDEAHRLADLVWRAANRLVDASSPFSSERAAQESAKTAFRTTMEELREEVIKCPSSQLARALGY